MPKPAEAVNLSVKDICKCSAGRGRCCCCLGRLPYLGGHSALGQPTKHHRPLHHLGMGRRLASPTHSPTPTSNWFNVHKCLSSFSQRFFFLFPRCLNGSCSCCLARMHRHLLGVSIRPQKACFWNIQDGYVCEAPSSEGAWKHDRTQHSLTHLKSLCFLLLHSFQCQGIGNPRRSDWIWLGSPSGFRILEYSHQDVNVCIFIYSSDIICLS